MKRLGRLVVLLLCMVLTACTTAPSVLEWSGDTALIWVDGEPLVTVDDFTRVYQERMVYAEVYGGEAEPEQEVFMRYAELKLASFFAHVFGVADDREDFWQLFEADLEAWEGNDFAYLSLLRERLELEENVFNAWLFDLSMLQEDADALIADVGKTYARVEDGAQLEEYILANLQQLLAMYNVTCDYPLQTTISFEHIL